MNENKNRYHTNGACVTFEKLNDSRKSEIVLTQLEKHVENIDRIL
jgi:hypothetical protein